MPDINARFHRMARRIAWAFIAWLIRRSRWHNAVLDTDVPNVGCLRVVDLTVVNSYGQQRRLWASGIKVKERESHG